MAAAAVQLPTTSFGPKDTFQAAPQTQDQDDDATPLTARKHDVETTLNFHKDNEDGSPPHPTYVDRPETYDRAVDTHKVTIKDIRGEEDKYSLDTTGFQVHRHTSVEKDFVDDEQVKARYYPEIEQLLKDVTGASRIHVFDHIIRRAPAVFPNKDGLNRGPVQRVHIDQSYKAALTRVSQHLPPTESSRLLQSRVQIINVWRPIRRVLRDPLAVASAPSIAEEDLVINELIYPDRVGETLAVRYNKGQEWCYKSGLEPGEVLLLKCFDSKLDGRARRSPHSAFVDPAAGKEVETRESIEVRALVFHEDDTLE